MLGDVDSSAANLRQLSTVMELRSTRLCITLHACHFDASAPLSLCDEGELKGDWLAIEFSSLLADSAVHKVMLSSRTI